MSKNNSLLLIDAGNTLVKVGLIENGALYEVKRFQLNEYTLFKDFITSTSISDGIISSVLSDKDTEKWIEALPNVFIVDSSTPNPLTNAYTTPETLGVDRICNACGMLPKLNTQYGVCIDIGTCIKFDLIDQDDVYIGGSISPGINLRYKSLNDYTGKLPLLSNKNEVSIVGIDTESSMRSGVINGVKKEIEGFIQSYRDQYESLTFFVTGGDAKYFDLESKNDIFADENLTLLGLYEIFKHNA